MDVERLATKLIEARRSGIRIAALAAQETPANAAEAYAVQDAILRQLGIAVAGWKVGAASPDAEPQAGPLLADRLLPSPARFALLPNALRTAEAELAFRIARDLPPRSHTYGEDEVWEALASLHVGIEILESSFVDRRKIAEAAVLGDLLNNGGYSYGAPLADWRALDLAAPQAVLIIDGKEIRRAKAGTPGGHPKRLLAWLANHAAARGRPLKRGDIVTTGSHTGMIDAVPGAQVTARFEDIGEASLIFAA
ncbi:MAG TPA: fumarylacetoacetate hydrolase family protein [Stellaceae bacterium]|nr:fumarylacetoacetate hydrolase family protein [Stellaceae bacterium]